MKILPPWLVGLFVLTSNVVALGQKPIISFTSTDDSFQIFGGNITTGQIRVSKDDYWGVIRAAGDLAVDFGRVTGTNFTLSNGDTDASPAKYTFEPVDVTNNTYVSADRAIGSSQLISRISIGRLMRNRSRAQSIMPPILPTPSLSSEPSATPKSLTSSLRTGQSTPAKLKENGKHLLAS